jgi:hypothetical protein
MAPGSGTSVATRPGASGVPRWSCEPCQNRRVQLSFPRAPPGQHHRLDAAAREERKVGFEDQRTVSEQPDFGVAVEMGHALVDGDGIERHACAFIDCGGCDYIDDFSNSPK